MKRRLISTREYEAQRLVSRLLHPETMGVGMNWINLERLEIPTYHIEMPYNQIIDERNRNKGNYERARHLNHTLPDKVQEIMNIVNREERIAVFPNVDTQFDEYMNLEETVESLETNPMIDKFGINDLDRMRNKITWFENIYMMTGTLPRQIIPHIPESYRYVEAKYVREHTNICHYYITGIQDARGMLIQTEGIPTAGVRGLEGHPILNIRNPMEVFPIVLVDTVMRQKIMEWLRANPNIPLVQMHVTGLPRAFMHKEFRAFSLKYLITRTEIIIISSEPPDLTDLGRCLHEDEPFGHWVITQYQKAYYMHVSPDVFRRIQTRDTYLVNDFNVLKLDVSFTTRPDDYDRYDDKIPKEKDLSEHDLMIVGKYLTLNDHLKLRKTCKRYGSVYNQYRVTPFGLETGKELELFENAEEVRVYDDNPSYELLPREHARVMVRFLLYMDAVCKQLGYGEEYSDALVAITRTSTPESDDFGISRTN